MNELDFLKGLAPSSENVAWYIAETLQKEFSETTFKVSRVTAWESDDACATYIMP